MLVREAWDHQYIKSDPHSNPQRLCPDIIIAIMWGKVSFHRSKKNHHFLDDGLFQSTLPGVSSSALSADDKYYSKDIPALPK